MLEVTSQITTTRVKNSPKLALIISLIGVGRSHFTISFKKIITSVKVELEYMNREIQYAQNTYHGYYETFYFSSDWTRWRSYIYTYTDYRVAQK